MARAQFGKHGRPVEASPGNHGAADAIESHGSLRFQVNGNRHVLIEAQFAGWSMRGALLANPKLERSLARGSKPAINAIEVALR